MAAEPSASSTTLKEAIETMLRQSGEPISRLQISKNLKEKLGQSYSNQEVNQTLYDNPDTFLTKPGKPPLWTLTQRAIASGGVTSDSDKHSESVYVFIDLGNVHSLTEPLSEYPHVVVMGFCDCYYDGARPKISHAAKSKIPGTSNALLVYHFTEIYHNTSASAKYIICSKNSIFAGFPEAFQNTTVITTWNDLRYQI